MNWYKKAQNKIVSFDEIVSTIDSIICKKGLLSKEDFRNAWDSLSLSKAAQVDTAVDLTQDVIELVRSGISKPKDIAKRLNVSVNKVEDILKQYKLKKPSDRNQFYDEMFLEDVDKKYDDYSDSFEKITVKEVAQELNTTEAVIKGVCKRNGYSFQELTRNRRARIAKYINELIIELRQEGIRLTVKVLGQEFKQRTGVKISKSAVDRAIVESNNSLDGQKKAPLFRLFNHFFWERQGIGFQSFFEQYGENTNAMMRDLNSIIDKFFETKGPILFDENFGFLNVDETNGYNKAKELLYHKLNIRDYVMNKNEMNQGISNNDISPYVKNRIKYLLHNGSSVDEVSRSLNVSRNVVENIQQDIQYNKENYPSGGFDNTFLMDR